MECLGGTIFPPTFILETASSACIILVALVGWPSHTSWVDPRYRARKRTPSIRTLGSVSGPAGRRSYNLLDIYDLEDGRQHNGQNDQLK